MVVGTKSGKSAECTTGNFGNTVIKGHRRESAIEAKFRQACRRYGGEAVKLGHSGKPDQLVLWDQGITTYAELKRPGEGPEPHQEEAIQRMRDKGHLVHVVHDEQEMAAFIAASLRRVISHG